LKRNPAGRALDALTIALVATALLLSTLSLPWREVPPDGPPRLLGAASGNGLLLAGFGVRRLELGPAPVIGGFPRWSYAADGVRDPVTARALLLSEPGARVALVSVEILVIPEALEAAVRARLADLKLDALVLTATHTHSGPGGYWDSWVAGQSRCGTAPGESRGRVVPTRATARRGEASAGPVPSALMVSSSSRA
jgi:neutral ceramidase